MADISLYFLAFAAECLETRQAQEEVLGIFDTITKVTCSSAEPIKNDLKQIWSWAEAHPHMVTPAQMHSHFYELDPSLSVPNHPGSSPNLHNPLLTTGDFSLENHPYQGYYVPPHHHHALDQYQYGSFDLIWCFEHFDESWILLPASHSYTSYPCEYNNSRFRFTYVGPSPSLTVYISIAWLIWSVVDAWTSMYLGCWIWKWPGRCVPFQLGFNNLLPCI